MLEVIIPVHNESRPIERAVSSALAEDTGDLLVTVVCHNLDPELVKPKLAHLHGNIQYLTCNGHRGSPAAPINVGIDNSQAEYVTFLDSDDELQLNSLRSWRNQADASGADLVIARMTEEPETSVSYPDVRIGRIHKLDPVKDRLFYRNSRMGLWRKSFLDTAQLRFALDMPTGEDQPFMAKAFARAKRIELATPKAGVLYAHNDQLDRIQKTSFAADNVLAGARASVNSDWFKQLPLPQRRALAIKILRKEVIPTLRSPLAQWDEAAWEAAGNLVNQLESTADKVTVPLSMWEKRCLERLNQNPETGWDNIVKSVQPSSRWEQISSGNPVTDLFNRESLFRRALVRRLGNQFLGKYLER